VGCGPLREQADTGHGTQREREQTGHQTGSRPLRLLPVPGRR
jgi:hypothetical protein